MIGPQDGKEEEEAEEKEEARAMSSYDGRGTRVGAESTHAENNEETRLWHGSASAAAAASSTAAAALLRAASRGHRDVLGDVLRRVARDAATTPADTALGDLVNCVDSQVSFIAQGRI